MRLLLRHEVEPGARFMIRAVVADPRLAENLPAKAAFVIVALVAVVVLRERAVRRNLEPVRRRAQPDHRTAALEVIDDRLHLLGRQVLEAGEDDHQVGGLQRLRAGNVRLPGLDHAVLRIHAEKHRAFAP